MGLGRRGGKRDPREEEVGVDARGRGSIWENGNDS